MPQRPPSPPSAARPAAPTLPRRLLPALLAALLSTAPAAAAGSSATPPAASAPAQETGRFLLRGFEVVGAQQLPADELQALLAPAIGREIDLAGLQAAAERVTQAYRRRGLALASAHVPPQEVRDGVVRLVVVEGRLGQVRLRNASRLADATLAQALAAAAGGPGEGVDLAELQRRLQQLGERSGLVVSATLRPGASLGTADLELVVGDGRRFEAELTLDNHGQRHSGAWRLRTELRGAALLAEGDSASLTLLGAGPGLRHGRLAWQLAPAAAPAWRLGAAASTLHYRLRGELAALQARGQADSLSVYALRQLHRSDRAALQLQAVWERKALADELGAGAVVSHKRARLATLGLSGERADAGLGPGRGGTWQGAASIVGGRLELDPETAALDAAGAGSQGRYAKLALQAARLQSLGGGWEAALRAQAQASDGNLDGSERLALGGPAAVRALDSGAAAVDLGWLATLELRHRRADGWALGVLADAAAGHVRRHPGPGEDNRRRANGHGFLLEATQGAWQFSLQAAWAAGLSPRDARLWAQASWRLP